MQHQPVLKVEGVSKSFYGLKALDNISFEISKGEIVGLLGANGAGKSTLLKIIGGVLNADKGSIIYEGKRVEFKNPHEAQKNGIISVYQEINLFQNMTVAENLFIGKEIKSKAGVINWKAACKEAREILDNLGLDISEKATVSSLSTAQQHMIEIARAINESPNILLLDEPTASLSENQIRWLFGKVRELVKAGTTIIYVSHRLDEVVELCNRCIILRDGKLAQTLNDGFDRNTIVYHMIGRQVSFKRREVSCKIDESALELRNVTTGNKVNDISFYLCKGEILGIAGLVGAGRTELLRAIYGIDRITSGKVFRNGKEILVRTPQDAIENGIVLISEDRKLEQLFMSESVKFNISAATLKKRTKKGLIDFRGENLAVQKAADDVMLDKNRTDDLVRALSGGNQQKAVIAKNLLAEADVILMDEPTRGVDVGARSEIYNIINNLAQQGKSILMVSSDWEELMVMCDRVLVMSEGHITGELTGDGITEENMMHLSTIAKVKGDEKEESEKDDKRESRHFKHKLHRISELARMMTANNTVLLFAILMAFLIIGSIISSSFRTISNMRNIVAQTVVSMLLALGQLVVIIAGGIDLSVGGTFAVVNVLGLTFMLKYPEYIPIWIAGMIAVGIIIGAINGILAVKAKVDAFVATLGVSIFLQGLALIITKRPIAPTPKVIRDFASKAFLGVPNSFILLLVVLAVFYVLLRYVPMGRRFFAVGENAVTSYWSGLPVTTTKFASFAICGLMSSVAGIYMIGRTGAADPAYGPGLELDAIACSLIGGATLAGGRGSLAGTAFAVGIFTVLANILNHLGVGMYYQNVLRGVLMLIIIISYEKKASKANI